MSFVGLRRRLWVATTVGCWAASTLVSAQAIDPRYAAERAAKQAAKQAAAGPPVSDGRMLPLNGKIAAKTGRDDKQVNWIWRVACFRLDAAPGDLVEVGSNVFGERSILGSTTDSCDVDPQLSVTTALDNIEDGGNRSLLIRQGQWPTYVKLWMRGTDRAYELTSLKLTPAEFATLEANLRRAEQQARQRRAERRAAFGQMLAAGVAVGGVAAAGGDVSAVPLNGNPLEILNGANDEIARQNETSQARFNATMEQARSQVDRQRRDQATGIDAKTAAAQREAAGGPDDAAQRQSLTPAPTASPTRQVAAASEPVGQTMYGFCWAAQTSAGDSPIYHSRIGRTDRYLNGGTTDHPNERWLTRMQAEFAGQIGQHVAPICYDNSSPSGFDYNISTNRQNHAIIEIPWAPH